MLRTAKTRDRSPESSHVKSRVDPRYTADDKLICFMIPKSVHKIEYQSVTLPDSNAGYRPQLSGYIIEKCHSRGALNSGKGSAKAELPSPYFTRNVL